MWSTLEANNGFKGTRTPISSQDHGKLTIKKNKGIKYKLTIKSKSVHLDDKDLLFTDEGDLIIATDTAPTARNSLLNMGFSDKNFNNNTNVTDRNIHIVTPSPKIETTTTPQPSKEKKTKLEKPHTSRKHQAHLARERAVTKFRKGKRNKYTNHDNSIPILDDHLLRQTPTNEIPLLSLDEQRRLNSLNAAQRIRQTARKSLAIISDIRDIANQIDDRKERNNITKRLIDLETPLVLRRTITVDDAKTTRPAKKGKRPHHNYNTPKNTKGVDTLIPEEIMSINEQIPALSLSAIREHLSESFPGLKGESNKKPPKAPEIRDSTIDRPLNRKQRRNQQFNHDLPPKKVSFGNGIKRKMTTREAIMAGIETLPGPVLYRCDSQTTCRCNNHHLCRSQIRRLLHYHTVRPAGPAPAPRAPFNAGTRRISERGPRTSNPRDFAVCTDTNCHDMTHFHPSTICTAGTPIHIDNQLHEILPAEVIHQPTPLQEGLEDYAEHLLAQDDNRQQSDANEYSDADLYGANNCNLCSLSNTVTPHTFACRCRYRLCDPCHQRVSTCPGCRLPLRVQPNLVSRPDPNDANSLPSPINPSGSTHSAGDSSLVEQLHVTERVVEADLTASTFFGPPVTTIVFTITTTTNTTSTSSVNTTTPTPLHLISTDDLVYRLSIADTRTRLLYEFLRRLNARIRNYGVNAEGAAVARRLHFQQIFLPDFPGYPAFPEPWDYADLPNPPATGYFATDDRAVATEMTDWSAYIATRFTSPLIGSTTITSTTTSTTTQVVHPTTTTDSPTITAPQTNQVETLVTEAVLANTVPVNNTSSIDDLVNVLRHGRIPGVTAINNITFIPSNTHTTIENTSNTAETTPANVTSTTTVLSNGTYTPLIFLPASSNPLTNTTADAPTLIVYNCQPQTTDETSPPQAKLADNTGWGKYDGSKDVETPDVNCPPFVYYDPPGGPPDDATFSGIRFSAVQTAKRKIYFNETYVNDPDSSWLESLFVNYSKYQGRDGRYLPMPISPQHCNSYLHYTIKYPLVLRLLSLGYLNQISFVRSNENNMLRAAGFTHFIHMEVDLGLLGLMMTMKATASVSPHTSTEAPTNEKMTRVIYETIRILELNHPWCRMFHACYACPLHRFNIINNTARLFMNYRVINTLLDVRMAMKKPGFLNFL